MRTRGPRLCKFGGARMARTAKDRVTNQEFPSCHSWERKRRQKLRIKLFSSQKKRRKAAPLQQTFLDAHVSTCAEDIFGREGSCCFMIFMIFICIFVSAIFGFVCGAVARWSTSESLRGWTLHPWRRAFSSASVICTLWFENFFKLKSGIPVAGHFSFRCAGLCKWRRCWRL